MSGQAPPRVLVFDSGVGGLSVAACIHEHLSGLEIVYLADNAGFPYGDKSETVVIDRCCTLIARALELYPSDVIVVACNTASTVVLPHLRAMTRVPVVGVVPAIKPAAAKTMNRRIGLLATPATVRRPYLDRLVEEFAGDCRVERIGHPGLVRWAEDLVSGTEVPFAELQAAMKPFRDADVDTVVLGCTHYPFLRAPIERYMGPGVNVIDSGVAIARRLETVLNELGWRRERGEVGTIRLATSGDPAVVGAVAELLFGEPVTVVDHAEDLADTDFRAGDVPLGVIS